MISMDNLADITIRLTKGNPGALTALMEVFQVPEIEDSKDQMGAVREVAKYLTINKIAGPNIWLCYKDICKEDATLLYAKIKDGTIASLLAGLPYAEYTPPTAKELEENENAYLAEENENSSIDSQGLQAMAFEFLNACAVFVSNTKIADGQNGAVTSAEPLGVAVQVLSEVNRDTTLENIKRKKARKG